ncbi:MAG: DUF1284 domain-containing protein [Anaerosomatales bacterium]|nr:DUF1284 domain-containing protein [Anaerosomatales bacterium]MDT8434320.1 DUF1284 domain-containing protein [Anaerosomatales bacterium]
MSERGLRIRGHHLICLQYFHGQGYSPEFAHHLFTIVDRFTRGEKGVAVVGPDDVCIACPSYALEQCAQEPESEHAIRVLDALALEMLELDEGQEFEWGVATLSVQRIIERWRALACEGCGWEEQCRALIDQTAGYRPT